MELVNISSKWPWWKSDQGPRWKSAEKELDGFSRYCGEEKKMKKKWMKEKS